VVTAIWLLHLVGDPAPILGEVARVLRAGGRFVTTVDKNAAHGHRVRQVLGARFRPTRGLFGTSAGSNSPRILL
jgi:ubiquinone/menaquinone biosynthesis C-methylase UbiE